MQTYPNRDLVIESLLDTAREAAVESAGNHPEDIANAMSMALDNAGKAINIFYQKSLTWPT